MARTSPQPSAALPDNDAAFSFAGGFPAASAPSARAAQAPGRDAELHPDQNTAEAGAGPGNRRDLWLQRAAPSFIFDDITDPALLSLFQPPSASSPASDADARLSEAQDRLAERERKRKLALVGDAMTRQVQGVLADFIREFSNAAAKGGEQTERYAQARQTFYQVLKVFNSAKVAAYAGDRDDMVVKLEEAQSGWSAFARVDFKHVAKVFQKSSQDTAALKRALAALLVQCSHWLADDDTASPPASPAGGSSGRQRACSTPVKPSAGWADPELKDLAGAGGKPSEPHSPRSAQHRLAHSFTAAPGAAPRAASGPSPLASPTGSPPATPVHSPRSSASLQHAFLVPGVLGTLAASVRDPDGPAASTRMPADTKAASIAGADTALPAHENATGNAGRLQAKHQ